MIRVVFASRARDDLRGIFRYIAMDNPEAARKLIRELRARCTFLMHFPLLGVACDQVSPGLRRFTLRGYNIYYRVLGSVVRIVRVLHPSLDTERQEF